MCFVQVRKGLRLIRRKHERPNDRHRFYKGEQDAKERGTVAKRAVSPKALAAQTCRNVKRRAKKAPKSVSGLKVVMRKRSGGDPEIERNQNQRIQDRTPSQQRQ